MQLRIDTLDRIASPKFSSPTVILVPQGAEYHAVRRGMGALPLSSQLPSVYPIPMGSEPVSKYLQQWITEIIPDRPTLLVLGLAGSLSAQHRVGDVVVYQQCCNLAPEQPLQSLECDRALTQFLSDRLTPHTQPVTGLTSSHIITQATKKQNLGQTYQASVVDMEGFAILKTLQSAGIAVGMVRVIGDRHNQDLPNLNDAINAQGQLAPIPLALQMLKHPLNAMNLIHGSLKSLPILSQIAIQLYKDT
ncbi:MAG: phosphorylase [Roseofilum sp. SBFL]|uniref:phosphorylase family protein n=1 Tax=unclassified Roseofilum TaxID=2620099 RepID=UPI001B242D32|nr:MULTISPECIES: hypothetical protein [unclassified Roseofilum]MBP0012127.1 phosphorylase [Roseofilum sp. SID3]MBP0023931.1 phosphorylase [Roseofilum sp. SID2]MBP0044461.1 phosphorylase [Roseofilum sp. SBFL]